MSDIPAVPETALRRFFTKSTVVVGGVYGAVLGSSVIAALTPQDAGSRDDRLYDAKWLFITAVVTAAAHGYAHLLAHRAQRRLGALVSVRTILDEWPLVVGTLPTVLLLVGAGLGWWGSGSVEDVAFTVNIVLLFGWGLITARFGGRPWRTSLFIAFGDALLGLVVVVANALVKK